MFLFAIAYLLGDLLVQSRPQLPSNFLIILVLVVGGIGFAALFRRWRYAYLCLAFSLGWGMTAYYASKIISPIVPNKATTIVGYIAVLPVQTAQQTNFIFATDTLRIRLNWRNNSKKIKVGDQWQLQVKLKRIHGTQNPGGFDYDAWALQKGIRATGYVLTHGKNRLLTHAWYRFPLQHIRQKLQERITMALPISSTAPWLMALIIGERNGIVQQDWQVLRQTGTNHLMAVAGLHIGMIAGFMHGLTTWVWKSVPRLMLLFPAHLAGACAGLIVATLYSALAGFSIPTERACMMLSVFIVVLLSRRRVNSWNVWALALMTVLLLNPLSVLTDSFWLSFGTIGLIIYGMGGRLAPRGWWWRWGRVQWVICLGLLPLSFLLFQQGSLVSFVANSIAIPWLGLTILPCCFLSGILLLISPTMGGMLLQFADKSLGWLWVVLTWFSQLHFSTITLAVPTNGLFVLAVGGFLLLLLPRGSSLRWLGLLWIAPIFLYQPVLPRHGDYWVTLLDVGQGLAVVIKTQQHTLVFDAGPRYDDHIDMGESVVLPYLRATATKKIDLLVVSHGDNDHVGGVNALLRALPVAEIKTSVPAMLPISARYCLAGDTWKWDGVSFTFLHPRIQDTRLDNDGSCVLRVDNGEQRVLLTGDIEKFAEKTLLTAAPNQLAADILIAPHHGSKTSILPKFALAVHPQFVLYATGYRNRYHFPHQSVVDFYNKMNVVQVNTAEAGAITFKLTRGASLVRPECYRYLHWHYWFD